jgi:hypothetical protein
MAILIFRAPMATPALLIVAILILREVEILPLQVETGIQQ